jgi:hypothetical protein
VRLLRATTPALGGLWAKISARELDENSCQSCLPCPALSRLNGINTPFLAKKHEKWQKTGLAEMAHPPFCPFSPKSNGFSAGKAFKPRLGKEKAEIRPTSPSLRFDSLARIFDQRPPRREMLNLFKSLPRRPLVKNSCQRVRRKFVPKLSPFPPLSRLNEGKQANLAKNHEKWQKTGLAEMAHPPFCPFSPKSNGFSAGKAFKPRLGKEKAEIRPTSPSLRFDSRARIFDQRPPLERVD